MAAKAEREAAGERKGVPGAGGSPRDQTARGRVPASRGRGRGAGGRGRGRGRASARTSLPDEATSALPDEAGAEAAGRPRRRAAAAVAQQSLGLHQLSNLRCDIWCAAEARSPGLSPFAHLRPPGAGVVYNPYVERCAVGRIWVIFS